MATKILAGTIWRSLRRGLEKAYALLDTSRFRAVILAHRAVRGKNARIGPRNIITLSADARIIVGDNFTTCRDVEIVAYGGAVIEFGQNCYVGHGTTIAAHARVTIGDYTQIADLVSIRDHNHGYGRDLPSSRFPPRIAPISIGANCWLGAKATLVAGVTLGHNVVVGANSVVTKSFGSNLVIAGCPARIIKKL